MSALNQNPHLLALLCDSPLADSKLLSKPVHTIDKFQLFAFYTRLKECKPDLAVSQVMRILAKETGMRLQAPGNFVPPDDCVTIIPCSSL